MKKLLFIVGLIIVGFLAYSSISKRSVEIEQDVSTRLTSAFDTQGISKNIQATVSGRDVTLSGTVAEGQSKEMAYKTAANLEGVRAVYNQVTVVEPPPVAVIEAITPVINEEPLIDLDILSEPEDGGMLDAVAGDKMDKDIDTKVAETTPLSDFNLDLQLGEAPVVETPVVTLDNIDLDQPLVIQNNKIIRRGVDSVTALKTVEAACERSLTSLLDGKKINFDSARATIKPESHKLLDRMVIAAKNCDEDTIITINGYTDNVGNIEANRRLSLRRARAVGQYMLKRGVAKQVKVVGNGPNDPIADNDTEEGRAQNRRIEFKVLRAPN